MHLPSRNIQRVLVYALCAGLAFGLVIYGAARVIEQALRPAPVLAALIALLLGLLLGVALFIGIKLALRQAAYDLHTYAVDLTNTPMPTTGSLLWSDEFAALREVVSRVAMLRPRPEVYARLAHELATVADIHAALDHTAHHLAATLPLSGAAIFLLDSERWLLTLAARWGQVSFTEQTALDAGETSLGRALREQRPVLSASAHVDDLRMIAADHERGTLLLLSLPGGDLPTGALCLVNSERPAAFAPDHLAYARDVAAMLALAIRRLLGEQLLNRERARLDAFEHLTASLNEAGELQTALERVLRTAASITDSEHGTLLLLDADESQVRYRIALDAGSLSPLDIVAGPLLKHGLAGWAIRERRGDVIADTRHDARWLPAPSLDDMRSALVAPLLYGERALGVLTLADPKPHHYSPRSQALVSGLATYAATLLVHLDPATAAPQLSASLYRLLEGHLPPAVLNEVSKDPVRSALLRQPRLREVIVICAGIQGFAHLSEHLDPETLLHTVLSPFLAAMSMVAYEHQGYVRRHGGEVLSVFGYVPPGDGERRQAIKAAQAMQAAARQLQSRWRASLGRALTTSMGMARGPVVAGVVGDAPHQEHLVLGSVINRARRLQALARAGEVLMPEDVVSGTLVNGSIRFEALRPTLRTGSGETQRLYRLLS